jgi:hypothetical protein
MRTFNLLVVVLAWAPGCDRRQPARDCGWPDIPPIPGSRYLRETAETTWNTCDVMDYIKLDRAERLDIHPFDDDAGIYYNTTFSSASDAHGVYSPRVMEDPEQPGVWPATRGTTRGIYIMPDGSLNRDVEEAITVTMRIDEFESIEVIGEFEIFCANPLHCHAFNSRNERACGFGRRWTYRYSHEIDDYFPQSARWLEPDDCDAPDSPYREE